MGITALDGITRAFGYSSWTCTGERNRHDVSSCAEIRAAKTRGRWWVGMDAVCIIRWSRITPGREAQAYEAFPVFMDFWAKQAGDGKCGEPVPAFAPDNSAGMLMIPGERQALEAILDSEEARKLGIWGDRVVDGLQTLVWDSGEQIQQGLERGRSQLSELGLL